MLHINLKMVFTVMNNLAVRYSNFHALKLDYTNLPKRSDKVQKWSCGSWTPSTAV